MYGRGSRLHTTELWPTLTSLLDNQGTYTYTESKIILNFVYAIVLVIVFVVVMVYCYRLEAVTIPDPTTQVSPNATFPGDCYDPSLDFLAGSVSNVPIL